MSVDINGKECKCGNRGCLEAMANVPAICEVCGTSDISDITEDKAEKLSDICRYIASGINNIINMINPEVVVIGGEITKLGSFFLDMLRSELCKIMLADNENFLLEFSSVSGNPVTRGAGRYLLDRVFEDGDFIIE